MKPLLSRVPALLLSLFLQLAPLLRVATAEASAVASPIVAVLRWIVGASAVAGSFHAVSGATGLKITPSSNGSFGIAFGARVTISSTQWGLMRSFEADGLPPGIVMSTQGVFTGKPTQGGTFTATLTGWQNSNKTGFDFRADAMFTILDPEAIPPTITLAPVSLTVGEGQPALLDVAASGNPNPTFQWTFEGAPIAGATSPRFQIVKTGLADAGTYSVVIQNRAGSVTSEPVNLSVHPAPRIPTITAQPTGVTADAGSDVSFTVLADGTEPLTYRWNLNGEPIAGASGPTLSLGAVRSAQSGSYQAKVSNPAGEVLSNAVTLRIVPLVVPGPVELGVPILAGQDIRFRFAVEPAHGYVVESRSAVGLGDWKVLAEVAPAVVAGFTEITDPVSAFGRFYRVRPLP